MATPSAAYCNIVAEIDAVVTHRNVNPGYDFLVGQSLMGIRSLRDIWFDADLQRDAVALWPHLGFYGGGLDQHWRCCRRRVPRGNFVKVEYVAVVVLVDGQIGSLTDTQVVRQTARIDIEDYNPD
jgi:hypothetical protein